MVSGVSWHAPKRNTFDGSAVDVSPVQKLSPIRSRPYLMGDDTLILFSERSTSLNFSSAIFNLPSIRDVMILSASITRNTFLCTHDSCWGLMLSPVLFDEQCDINMMSFK